MVTILLAGSAVAQTPTAPLLSACDGAPPACSAIRGDRAEGWLAQSRAEVMAQHGIVTTSQPLAAEAGLAILRRGVNAIDAAVTTAAVLNVVEPMNVGIGGDPGKIAANGDTIVLSTADAEGNVVAWVNSNYAPFGSGLTVPGYGFILHDRGALFSLDPASPNLIAPHKRPFNTLSAGFVMDGERPLMSLLLMGGEMRAQGHAQALVDIFDLGANLQMATDIARFHHSQVSNQLTLEPELNATVGSALAAMGPSADPALERQGRRLSGDLYRASGGTGDIADLSRRLRPSQGWSSSRLVGSGATSLRRLAEALNARTS
jgi:gamma-glutamyltranspeptidase